MPFRNALQLKNHIAAFEAKGVDLSKVSCWGWDDGAILFIYKDGKVAVPLDDFDNYERHKMNIKEERHRKKIDLDAVDTSADVAQQAAQLESQAHWLPFSGLPEIEYAFGPSDANHGELEWKKLGARLIPDSIEWDKEQ